MVGDMLANEGLVGVLGTTVIGSETPTPRQRALLGALALGGSFGSDIDTLADGVWGGRPPASARSSLQNQMTRLRRHHGHDLVICVGTRYRLGRPTDVMRFEQELTATASSDLATRIGLLTTALGRWRGAPYADLDCHAAEIERARLLEMRMTAADQLATARLEVGSFDECIGDLRVEIEADPYRDRAWELLVIALARAGRRTEAVLTINEYGHRLHAEFGIDPSDRIAELRAQLGRVIAAEPSARPRTAATGRLTPPHTAGTRRCRRRHRRDSDTAQP